MFHVAFSRGQGPAYADLPPTLQPCAIAASAPPSDRLRAAAFSGLIYLLLGASVLTVAALTPRPVVLPPVAPTSSERVIELIDLPLSRPAERVAVAAGGSGGGIVTSEAKAAATNQNVPEEAALGKPVDRSGETPGPVGPALTHATQPLGNPAVGSTASGTQIFSMVGLAVLHRVDPVYPEFARRARIQGPVVLLMTVDEQGQPTQVQVLEGHPAFHEAAVQAARQWRFEPARMDGRPVSATFRLTLKFALR
ncbi:MAG TPA: energy transducer TonB [Geothrix sp.]|nr:energy transducer TonB [Geothrix sp.]